jgi:hypothetical protein
MEVRHRGTKRKYKVQPHRIPNDFGRKTMIFEQTIGNFHAIIMTHRSQYVYNLTMPLWEFDPETGDEERAK